LRPVAFLPELWRIAQATARPQKRVAKAESVKQSRDARRARLKRIAATGLLNVDESTRFPSSRLVGFQQLGGDYA